MAETTAISWTDATFNPWIGCAKVHTGCANCYAEADMDKRRGRARWGPNGTRSKTSEVYWKQPLKWEREAVAAQQRWDATPTEELTEFPPDRPRVFCASLADVFEDWRGPIVDHKGRTLVKETEESRSYRPATGNGDYLVTMDDLRRDLFALIDATPHLDWLILSKRPENIRRIWVNAQSTERKVCPRCGKERRAGDRQRRASLAASSATVEPLAERDGVSSMPAASSRNEEQAGISPGSGDAVKKASVRSSASPGVVSPARSDSGRNNHQSQGREQGEQPSVQSGAGDDERATYPRARGPQREKEQTAGIEAPKDEVDRGGRVGDSSPQGGRRDGQGHRVVVRNEAESDYCNCDPQDVEAHLSYRHNVWLGTSVSNQGTADKQIPRLLECRDLASVLFVSAEPLLGDIELAREWVSPSCPKCYGQMDRCDCDLKGEYPITRSLDWIIFGGESGHGARPCDVEWIRSGVQQCQEAGVAAYVKQLGSRPVCFDDGGMRGAELPECPYLVTDKKGADQDEWPEDLRIREMPQIGDRADHSEREPALMNHSPGRSLGATAGIRAS